MAPFLIGEEGPLSGLTVSFEEGDEWVIGRDPDLARVVLEDPMVSRKHACVRRTDLGYLLDNYSTVNPVTQNGKVCHGSGPRATGGPAPDRPPSFAAPRPLS